MGLRRKCLAVTALIISINSSLLVVIYWLLHELARIPANYINSDDDIAEDYFNQMSRLGLRFEPIGSNSFDIPGFEWEDALASLFLSRWIYMIGMGPEVTWLLPKGLKLLYFIKGDDAETGVQWAALSNKKRLFLVYAGTQNIFDLVVDTSFHVTSIGDTGIQGHSGIRAIVKQLTNETELLLSKHLKSFDELILTGHSLGGGYAQVMALRLLRGLFKRRRARFSGRKKYVTVYTFGGPSVFSGDLESPLAKKLGDRLFHFVNRFDVIPRSNGQGLNKVILNWFPFSLLRQDSGIDIFLRKLEDFKPLGHFFPLNAGKVSYFRGPKEIRSQFMQLTPNGPKVKFKGLLHWFRLSNLLKRLPRLMTPNQRRALKDFWQASISFPLFVRDHGMDAYDRHFASWRGRYGPIIIAGDQLRKNVDENKEEDNSDDAEQGDRVVVEEMFYCLGWNLTFESCPDPSLASFPMKLTWDYRPDNTLVHALSGLCVDVDSVSASLLMRPSPCPTAWSFKWGEWWTFQSFQSLGSVFIKENGELGLSTRGQKSRFIVSFVPGAEPVGTRSPENCEL